MTPVDLANLADSMRHMATLIQHDPARASDLSRELAGEGLENGQLTREDIAGMTPSELLAAKEAGRLDDLLGRW